MPKRALATGAGKTFIALHLLKRIADAGQLMRALFVCDSDEPRGQALTHLQSAFSADEPSGNRSRGTIAELPCRRFDVSLAAEPAHGQWPDETKFRPSALPRCNCAAIMSARQRGAKRAFRA